LGNNFRQQLWGAAFRSFVVIALENSFGHNFGEQRNPGEQLWGAVLGSSFEEQLCAAALKKPQLWGATLGSSFREPLWKIVLGNRFEV